MERDWRDAVFRIDSAASDKRDFGTAFVCHREGRETFLLTCRHVIEAIGANDACIRQLPVEWVQWGEDPLDLALIKVKGLTDSPLLALDVSGTPGQPFEIYGHSWADPKKKANGITLARLLSGRLGSDPAFYSSRGDKVPAWDLPFDKEDEFAELLEGYSGSPVRDPATGRVIAVVSHRRGAKMGYAIAASNLLKIYPAAEAFFHWPPKTTTRRARTDMGEYGHEDDWLVRTIDHSMQRGKIAERLECTTAGGPDRAYFHFEAIWDDLPHILADHVYLEQSRYDPETTTYATQLSHEQGRHAVWKALLRKVPDASEHARLQDQQQRVLNWINSRRLSVLFVMLDAKRDRAELPEMIEGACADLDALPHFQPGVRLILIFIGLKHQPGSSLMQRLWQFGQGPRITQRCCELSPLSPLSPVDIEDWLGRFTPSQERCYDKERLRTELQKLFQAQSPRYKVIHQHLTEGGVLRGARR